MTLNVKALALSSGILWGVLILATTLLACVLGAGEHLSHLAMVYPGYQVSYLGSFIGLAYGLISGVVTGAAFAWIYNKAAKTFG